MSVDCKGDGVDEPPLFDDRHTAPSLAGIVAARPCFRKARREGLNQEEPVRPAKQTASQRQSNDRRPNKRRSG